MNLYRNLFTVGGLTMVSRVLGFLRDILFAWAFGSGWVADAFNVAFRFPNLFRRLFGEGAFNSAFVPLFAKRLEGEGLGSAKAFAEEALAGLSLVLILLTIVAELTMPWLMELLAPGFRANPEKYDLAVLLTRLTFPYLWCMSVVALMSGVLNSVGQFVESSSISIVLNIVLTAAILLGFALGYRNDVNGGIVQALAVTIAGVLQVALLAEGLYRHRVWLKWVRPGWSADMRRLVGLGIPGIVSGGITQLNIVIGTAIATLQAGAVSHLYYADRLYELPLAIVGIAMGVVLLPDVSRHLRAGNEAAALDSQNRALEVSMLLTVPAAVALAVIPTEIVSVLFERGAYTSRDTPFTAYALAIFATGLPAFVMIKVFSPAFFAREDTKTPMRYATASLIANTAGSIALFFLFRSLGIMPHLGIAVATSLGGWLNAGLLWWGLAHHDHFRADARLKRQLPLIVVASLVMGLALMLAAPFAAPWLRSASPVLERFLALGGLVALGGAVYGGLSLAFGLVSLGQIGRLRGGRAAEPDRPAPEDVRG